jgi:ribose 5-phosphate isomerase B
MGESNKKVLIASDHAGIGLKRSLQFSLPDWDWEDLGPADGQRVDYPDFAEKLARKVAANEASRGILICGSGIGMCIAANKVDGIRAATAENPVSARLSREHNRSNVLCLGARFLATEYAVEITRVWLETRFTKDARHQARIDKITLMEQGKPAHETVSS